VGINEERAYEEGKGNRVGRVGREERERKGSCAPTEVLKFGA